MALELSHPDFWTRALQFTPTIHRDLYPALSHEAASIQQIAQGKVVIVTGAGSGFGKGACWQWAKSGAAAVVLAGRRQQQLDQVITELQAVAPRTKYLAVPCDVSSLEDTEHLFDQAMASFGRIDVVVHAAGVLGPVNNVGDTPVDDWWRAFEINAKGAYLVSRELVRRTSGQSSTYINTGTAASYFANPGQSAYTMSKLAVNMLLDQLHAEYPELRVFNVHPGMAKSSVLRPELEIYAKDTPELFGGLTVFLAGNEADFLRGRFVAANWDVRDLVKYQDQIVASGLLKSQPFKGNIGDGGHFSSD
ncbi:hypothetical protein B0A52_07886 [Exophiala mesophila]|uniref:Ketoreductase domain-containing protein n=1 Tax=Exophiala mesophila TaxID=212818 RepID=A0A438MVI1_EXOME|nr:hypothetical protein B0A52_07886 [Exophiala mesophila]